MAPDDQSEQLLDRIVDRVLDAQPVWQPPAAFAKNIGYIGARIVLGQERTPPRLSVLDWLHAGIAGLSTATIAGGAGYVLWLAVPQLQAAPEAVAWSCALLLALLLLRRLLPLTV